MTNIRWVRALAWAILAAAVGIFAVTTWPAILYVIPIGVGFVAVLWAICVLVATHEDSPDDPT